MTLIKCTILVLKFFVHRIQEIYNNSAEDERKSHPAIQDIIQNFSDASTVLKNSQDLVTPKKNVN